METNLLSSSGCREAGFSELPAASKDESEHDWVEVDPPSKNNWLVVNKFADSPAKEMVEDDEGFGLVEAPGSSKDDLKAYLSLRKNSFVTGSSINDGGNIALRAETIPETLGGKAVQFLGFNHRPFVEEYYSVLKKNYGEEIADQVFPEENRKEAIRFGISKEIVFDSLKKAILISLERLEESEEQRGMSEHDAVQHKESAKDNSLLIKQHLRDLKNLLADVPDASKNGTSGSAPDTRSTFTKMASLLVQATDLTMTAQSSTAWARRTLFVLRSLGVI